MAVHTFSLQSETESHSRARLRLWVHRLYVPIVTLGLVFVVGHWLAAREKVDPLAVAQHNRLTFKTEGVSELSRTGGLSEREATEAAAVLSKNRTIADDRLKILYLGNSQTLAIMDEQPDDLTTPQWLQVLLSRQSPDSVVRANVILGSEPNITMTEVLIKLVSAGEQTPRQCDVFLDSAVLEEYRGLGVRDNILKAVDRQGVRDRLAALLKVNHDLTSAVNALDPVVRGTEETGIAHGARAGPSERLENGLQRLVEGNSVFAHRMDLQVEVALGFFLVRNKLLRIDSATVRPVPESSYRASLELLEMALRYARENGIHVVLYLSPIRPIKPNPNVPADVVRFRREVPALCRRYGAMCLDYTDLVPEKLWTQYPEDSPNPGGQRDFAHFTGAAHKLVAEKLVDDIAPQFRLWAEEKKPAPR